MVKRKNHEVQTSAIADYTREQEMPVPTVGPAMWDLVIEDMHKKDKAGECKYGVRLQAFNGRDPLVDAYQEVLDLAVYLRQQIYEREVHLKVLNGVRP